MGCSSLLLFHPLAVSVRACGREFNKQWGGKEERKIMSPDCPHCIQSTTFLLVLLAPLLSLLRCMFASRACRGKGMWKTALANASRLVGSRMNLQAAGVRHFGQGVKKVVPAPHSQVHAHSALLPGDGGRTV